MVMITVMKSLALPAAQPTAVAMTFAPIVDNLHVHAIP